MTADSDTRPPSLRRPQLPAIALGELSWVAEAIGAYRVAFEKTHDVTLEPSQVVRMALAEVLGVDGTDRLDIGKRPWLSEARIGPFRLIERYEYLPRSVARSVKLLKAAGVEATEADVIRAALAKWLADAGFGESVVRRGSKS